MIKILLGRSPCTFWSISQRADRRETTASGIGWELFRNYLIANKKFKPDLFLYENNCSASDAIKEQIECELGVERIEIDSALVSAQSRKRFYCVNWHATQPEDRGIVVDILENGVNLDGREKTYCLTARYNGAIPWNTLERKQRSMVAVRIGDIGSNTQAHRVYSVQGKSVCLKANGGGQGAKTGLYQVPLEDGEYIIRKLTPLECERLQTLPDNFTKCEGVSNSQRYKMLGNGWTAEIIIHLLGQGLAHVHRDEHLVVLSMYDGLGTGRYCLDKLGFKNITYHAYEIDKYAIAVAAKNYPDIIQHGDAFQVRSPFEDLKWV